MHGASIETAGTCLRAWAGGNRAPGARRSLYVALTMTILTGQAR